MNVTVVSAEEVKDKGEFKVFKVLCKDDDGLEIEADRASKWPPKPGDSGTIESTQYGPKFCPTPKAGSGGRGRSPQETKAIQRQHSQEMALRAIALLPTHMETFAPAPDTDRLRNAIKSWTNFFEEDIAS